jgi:hypothetical protein
MIFFQEEDKFRYILNYFLISPVMFLYAFSTCQSKKVSRQSKKVSRQSKKVSCQSKKVSCLVQTLKKRTGQCYVTLLKSKFCLTSLLRI